MTKVWNLARLALIGIAINLAAGSIAVAGEPTSIAVSLWNKNDGTMGITLSADRAKAGAVEFHIKNSSSQLLHEFLVTPWNGAITALPYDAKDAQVDEGKLPDLAGVEDMKPGAEAILRLPMKPGQYVLFCDQPGHYKMGMVRSFTVAP